MDCPSSEVLRFVEKMVVKLDHVAAFAEMHRLLRDEPGQLAPMLMECLIRLPESGTFFHAGLSLIAEDEFGELVNRSVSLLQIDRCHKAAADCISRAALQVPRSLQAHLHSLFDLRPNRRTVAECWPWRAAAEADVGFLQAVVGNGGGSESGREFAWRCLLETEDGANLAHSMRPPPAMINSPAEAYLTESGFDAAHELLRPLTLPGCFHIRFSDSYIDSFVDPVWRPKQIEPSWMLPVDESDRLRLGGFGEVECASCGGPTHHLLDFNPIPESLGIRSVRRLELLTCLSCLGWEQEILFFQHRADGDGIPLACGDRRNPESRCSPLSETLVHLVETPPRWLRQDWGASNARENLNRVGGHPTWIQSAQYPNCPKCDQKMPFLMQLDSNLPQLDGNEWLWGSGGIGYFFWCESCRITAGLWQCT